VTADGTGQTRALTHFFSGAQSREETASAYLATLLDYEPEFRRRFLALAPVDPPLDAALDWAVRVEDGRTNTGAVDVTLEGPRGTPTTIVMIENKLAASAKTEGQFLKYYRGAVSTWPERRVVGLYIAPSRGLAASEIDLVRGDEAYRARSGGSPNADAVFPLDWENDVAPVVRGLPGAADWFAATGIEEVLKAIAHPALPPDAQRAVLRDIANGAVEDLEGELPGVPFTVWHCLTEEDVLKPGGMLTISVIVVFRVDEQARVLGDVVGDDVVHVTLVTDFGLRGAAVKPPEVLSAWKALLREPRIEIGGMVFEPTLRRRLKSVEEVQVSREALQALIVERATQVTAFLQARPELRAFD
jgi:hypothetical protein